MNEHAAREVLLLKALEAEADALRREAAWAAEDAAWASRAALESAGATAAPDRFIAERAHHAMQRLAGREPAVRALLMRRPWRAQWPMWAAVLGVLLGLLADAIGSGQRINLLAPALWGVVAWNLVVYVLVLGHALLAVFTRSAPPSGWLSRAVQRGLLQPAGRWARRAAAARPGAVGETAGGTVGDRAGQAEGQAAGRLTGGSAGVAASESGPASRHRTSASGGGGRHLGLGVGFGASVLPAFEMAWIRHAAPLTAARAGVLLHTAAAALGLGLVAGLYLRGLVLDYRAGWESTFLEASQVHAVLTWLLAPASALYGLAVPDAATLQAMRVVPGNAAAGAPAALWIHLYALTLVMVVVLPRLALAVWSGVRAGVLVRRFPLALDEGYFQRLLRHQHGGAARVQVLPYAQAPGPLAEKNLRALLGRWFGDTAQVHVAPAVAFGTEDELAGQVLVPPGTALAVALFDLTATPETENQGRFVDLLARRPSIRSPDRPDVPDLPGVPDKARGSRKPESTEAPDASDASDGSDESGASEAPKASSAFPPGVVMLVDESAFVRRFGASSDRLAQRRDAWRQLAESLQTGVVFADLSAPDLLAAEQALQTALGEVRPSREAGAPAVN